MIKTYRFTNFKRFDFNDAIKQTCDNKVVLIIANITILRDENIIETYLSSEQIREKNNYYKQMDRNNYLLSHGIINRIFSSILRVEGKDVVWNYTNYKKPYIKNKMGIKFNISHTKGAIAIALSINDVGVDIEYMEKNFNYKDIVNYSFNKNEKINTVIDFYKYWVVKEAYLKYKGIGLIQDLRSIEIIEITNNRGILKDKNKTKTFEIKEINNDYSVAICF
ncbi:TPA: 4'-phosphopantetheinyl transferase superfamily protein [Clostridioides difficile]